MNIRGYVKNQCLYCLNTELQFTRVGVAVSSFRQIRVLLISFFEDFFKICSLTFSLDIGVRDGFDSVTNQSY